MRQIPSSNISLLILPLLCGLGLAIFLFSLATDHHLWLRWSAWLPYGYGAVFTDLSITLDHLDEAARGLDPLSDPKSEFAYPRAVLAFHHLGLQHLSHNWMGLFQSVCVATGIVLVLRPTTRLASIATSVLFFTPPILFGFERANLDFALFLLCAVCAWLWARSRVTPSLITPIAGLMLAAVLKLHPMFALISGVFVETGKRRILWILGLGLLLGFWVYNYSDFALIAPKIPVWIWGSWGCRVFFVRLVRFFELNGASDLLLNINWPLVAVLTYGVTAAAAFVVGTRLSRRFALVSWQARESSLFWIGAAICCGSFLGANLAYRWIFVLLTIPLLSQSIRASDRAVAIWARLTLLTIGISLIAPLNAHREIFLITQFANWSCILLLIAGCAALRAHANPQKWMPSNVSDFRPRHLSHVH